MLKHQEDIEKYAEDILVSENFNSQAHYIQHGAISVRAHELSVADKALDIARSLHSNVDEKALVRGALLHDFFLYDWHEPDPSRKWHGYTHPKTALHNAMAEFELSPVEQDMIVKHMWPLTLAFPKYKESWILTLADKIVSTKETLLCRKKKEETK